MAKIFLSFLGTSDYVPCRYGDENQWSPIVKFVQTATLLLHCGDWDAKSDRILIGCTDGAMRSNLAKLKDEFARNGLPEPMTIPLPDANATDDLWEIFDRLVAGIGEGDELVFDITHSFRFLPMLFTVLIQYLRVVKNSSVRGVYYGAFERLGTPKQVAELPESQRNAPLLDLTALLALYDWSTAIDHFLRFGSAADLERLVKTHIAPILKESRGADANASGLRQLVGELSEFAQGAQYARGKTLGTIQFRSKIVAPLTAIEQDFLPPLTPVLARLRATFEAWPDRSPDNVLRAVRWCIDHDLVQQGITLLQEAVVDEMTRRCAAPLGELPPKDSRELVSSLLGALARGAGPDQWHGCLQHHRRSAEACQALLPEGLVPAYDRLSGFRNDINHGGYLQPSAPKALRQALTVASDAIEGLLLDATEPVGADTAGTVYVLNTPVLTAWGRFYFQGPITPEEARKRLADGFESAIGHEGSAAFLSGVLDLPVPANRISVSMAPGDRALVLRIRTRLPEGAVLDAAAMAKIPYELGWLERLA